MSNPSSAGWHPHPTRRGKYGYFNGKTWDDEVRDAPPGSSKGRPKRERGANRVGATDCLVVGVLLSLVGGFVLNANESLLGYIVLGVGSAWLTVGLVAKGVAIGMREHAGGS